MDPVALFVRAGLSDVFGLRLLFPPAWFCHGPMRGCTSPLPGSYAILTCFGMKAAKLLGPDPAKR